MQCPGIKWLSIPPPPQKKSFGPKLISRFVAYKMKYQHSFSVSCQADSQIYAEDEKPEIVITPKKNYLLGEGGMPHQLWRLITNW